MKKILLFLALLLPSAVFAGPDTIFSSVCFSDPQGNCYANGLITFNLNVQAKAIVGGQVAPSQVSVTLDSTGKIPANTVLYGNDQLQPSGTFYRVTIFNSNGLLVSGKSALIWVISGASPVDLSLIVASSGSPDPGLANPVLQNPAAPQTVTGQPLTLTASAPLTVNSQITSTVSTGTAPFAISSTTNVPNLNASQLGGQSAPASAIVGISDTQTLTNKTLTGASNGNSVTLLCSSGPAAAITGNSSAQTFFSCTIPANAVANLKALRATAVWSHSTGTATVTYGLTLNGVACWPSNNTAATVGGLTQSANFIETGSTTGNVMTAQSFFSFTTNSLTGLAWTAGQTLAFTFNVANTDQVTPLFFLVELIQ